MASCSKWPSLDRLLAWLGEAPAGDQALAAGRQLSWVRRLPLQTLQSSPDYEEKRESRRLTAPALGQMGLWAGEATGEAMDEATGEQQL